MVALDPPLGDADGATIGGVVATADDALWERQRAQQRSSAGTVVRVSGLPPRCRGAGCGSSMKDYGDLLADDEEWAERATRFSDRVRDVSQLLAEGEPVAPRQPVPLKVAYHDACHLAHAQKVRSEPRQLLEGIPELELVDPAQWEICCGSAGIYNLLQPDAGRALGRRKAENLLATEAEAIASGNPGCTLQIAAHLREQGPPLPIYHPVQLLDRSIRGEGRP